METTDYILIIVAVTCVTYSVIAFYRDYKAASGKHDMKKAFNKKGKGHQAPSSLPTNDPTNQ